MQKISVLCAGSGQIGQKITEFLQDVGNGLQKRSKAIVLRICCTFAEPLLPAKHKAKRKKQHEGLAFLRWFCYAFALVT